jgi:hypothetical protein
MIHLALAILAFFFLLAFFAYGLRTIFEMLFHWWGWAIFIVVGCLALYVNWWNATYTDCYDQNGIPHTCLRR